jgi:hypothetical protein
LVTKCPASASTQSRVTIPKLDPDRRRASSKVKLHLALQSTSSSCCYFSTHIPPFSSPSTLANLENPF